MDRETLSHRLEASADGEYRGFMCRLVPTVPPETVLGVRIPVLRRLAGELRGTPEAAAFLTALPHPTFDENNLHALLLRDSRGLAALSRELEAFLPYVDNWATCDSLRPAVKPEELPMLDTLIPCWLASPHPYTRRFGLEMRMLHFLGADFSPAFLEEAAALPGEDYYVWMMQAWFFATALAAQWEATLPWLEPGRLPPALRRKALQKALESRRIPNERKALLRQLREG